MKFTVEPIAVVHNTREAVTDDNWGIVESVIELDERFPLESLDGIESFSHLEILYIFDRVGESEITTGARHPRGNSEWPVVGIFAQRAKARPNRIGTTFVQLLRRDGKYLHVLGLDAVDGTPVIDIKPVMSEFLPRAVVQPTWSNELMQNYWERWQEPVSGWTGFGLGAMLWCGVSMAAFGAGDLIWGPILLGIGIIFGGIAAYFWKRDTRT